MPNSILFVLAGLVCFGVLLLVLRRTHPEKTEAILPMALGLGAAAALFAVFGLGRAEVKEASFDAEYMVSFTSKNPLQQEDCPDLIKRSDAGWGSPTPASAVVPEIISRKHGQATAGSGAGQDSFMTVLYRDVLLRQMLDALRSEFQESWRETGSRGASGSRADIVLKSSQLAQMLDDPAADSQTYSAWNLPPKTEIKGINNGAEADLLLKNPFVEISLKITSLPESMAAVSARAMCRLLSQNELTNSTKIQLQIVLRAKFNRFRSENKEMERYKEWVDRMFAALKRFDSKDPRRGIYDMPIRSRMSGTMSEGWFPHSQFSSTNSPGRSFEERRREMQERSRLLRERHFGTNSTSNRRPLMLHERLNLGPGQSFPASPPRRTNSVPR